MDGSVLNGTSLETPYNGIVIRISYAMLITLVNGVFTLIFLGYQYGCINFFEFLTFFTTRKVHLLESKIDANRIMKTKDQWVFLGEVEPTMLLKTGKYVEFMEQNREEWARRTGASAFLQKKDLELRSLAYTYKIRRRLKFLHNYVMETKLIYWNKYNIFFQSRILCRGLVCAEGYVQVAIIDPKTEKRRKTDALISHLKLPAFEVQCPGELQDWVKHLIASGEALQKEEKESAGTSKTGHLEKLSPFLVPETKVGNAKKDKTKVKNKVDGKITKNMKNNVAGVKNNNTKRGIDLATNEEEPTKIADATLKTPATDDLK